MRKSRWVVKLGTGILTRPDGHLDPRQFAQIAAQVAGLVRRGHQVVLVSSGAIAAGMTEMGLTRRPTLTAHQQACATVGQIQLMAEYHRHFRKHKLSVAQLLLTYWDLDSRSCYRNASATLEHLLRQRRFIPIINENDALSSEEIKVGSTTASRPMSPRSSRPRASSFFPTSTACSMPPAPSSRSSSA
jgi:glutamate 5-kinase